MVKKIKYILLLTIIFVLAINLKSFARITTNDPTVNSGEKVTITINSQEPVASGAIVISSNSGLTFTGASGGTVNGNLVAFSQTENKTSGIAEYYFNAPSVTKDTTYTIVFASQDMANAEGTDVASSQATATVKVKAPNAPEPEPEPEPEPDPKPDPEPEPEPEPDPEPSFSSVNQTVYATTEVNVRSSWSTSSSVVGSLSEGESVTRIGKGDNGWSKVKYNGYTAYIFSDYLTTTKPEPKQEENTQNENKNEENNNEKSSNKYLESLEITNKDIKNKLTPEFDKEVTQYTLKVPESIEKLKINAKAENENATVKISGNDKLSAGSNVVKIKVTAEDETVRTYVINIEKDAKKEDTGLKLTQLSVSDIELSEEFDPNVFEYIAKLKDKDISKLSIQAKANDPDAIIEILGNENLQENDVNTITLLVKSKDGKEVATYQIKVEKVVEEKQQNIFEQFKDLIYLALILLVLLLIFVPIIIISKKRSKNDTEVYSDEEDFTNNSEDNNLDNEKNENDDEKTDSSLPDVNEKERIRNEFLNNIESGEENRIEYKRERRKKGKHF